MSARGRSQPSIDVRSTAASGGNPDIERTSAKDRVDPTRTSAEAAATVVVLSQRTRAVSRFRQRESPGPNKGYSGAVMACAVTG